MCVYTHTTHTRRYERSTNKGLIFLNNILLEVGISRAFVFLFRPFYIATFSKVHITFIIIKKDLKAEDNDSKVSPRIRGPLYALGKQGRLKTAASRWMPPTDRQVTKG